MISSYSTSSWAVISTQPVPLLLTVPRDWDEYGYHDWFRLCSCSLLIMVCWIWRLIRGAWYYPSLVCLMPNWTKRYAAPAKLEYACDCNQYRIFQGSVPAYKVKLGRPDPFNHLSEHPHNIGRLQVYASANLGICKNLVKSPL